MTKVLKICKSLDDLRFFNSLSAKNLSEYSYE